LFDPDPDYSGFVSPVAVPSPPFSDCCPLHGTQAEGSIARDKHRSPNHTPDAKTAALIDAGFLFDADVVEFPQWVGYWGSRLMGFEFEECSNFRFLFY